MTPYRIAVLGAGGSLGSRMLIQLRARGLERVVPISRARADLVNLSNLTRALDGCDLVFHLAGAADASFASADPVRTFAVNAQGAANVMEAIRDVRAKVVYASTSHVYGAPLQNPVREDHPTRPLSLYAASKLAGEAAVMGYASSFGFSAVIARLSNIYGGALSPRTVIGAALESVAAGLPIRLRSYQEVRDFLYVDDAIEGLIRLAIADVAGPAIVNVSSGIGHRISDVAAVLASSAEALGLAKPCIDPAFGSPDAAVPSLVLDNARLRQIVGWTPQVNLRDGLSRALREQRILSAA